MEEKKRHHNREDYVRRRRSEGDRRSGDDRRSGEDRRVPGSDVNYTGPERRQSEYDRRLSEDRRGELRPEEISEAAEAAKAKRDIWSDFNTYDPREKIRAWEDESGYSLLDNGEPTFRRPVKEPFPPAVAAEPAAETVATEEEPAPAAAKAKLPRWAWYAIGGAVLILAVVILVLALAQKSEAKTAEAVQTIVRQSEQQAAMYDYDKALATLQGHAEYGARPEIAAAVATVEQQKQGLVKYEGKIYHIFFHSLITDPAKAFDGDYKTWDYNMYYATVDEFKKMLPLLEANGFVLYPLHATAEVAADGSLTARDIYLPAGKKPLVLSIDDVAYYDYMEPDGFASRLVVDENGRVATMVKDADGELKETHDGDVMPIVDQYVDEHPAFSWQGAKGIVALTGYEGAFGYRITDLQGAELEKARKDVAAVAQCLRDSGWEIANHSYTHNGCFDDKTITMGQVQHDVKRWKELIGQYVGGTDIFISPYGVYYGEKDERQQYFYQAGYRFFCPVGNDTDIRYYDDHLVQYRFNIDGYTMQKRPDLVATYFDPAAVLDASRPAL